MDFINSFKNRIFSVDTDGFQPLALELCEYQYHNNPVYHQYINFLGVSVNNIQTLNEIPFLPIEFFKSHQVVTGKFTAQKVFYSSGTTSDVASRHLVKDTSFYNEVAKHIFGQLYGQLEDYNILALLPGYLEREGSSLLFMVKSFMDELGDEAVKGFYLHQLDQLHADLQKALATNRKTLLIGVTYALLDFAEKYPGDYSSLIVMETGGMKGTREEITREELHAFLTKSLKGIQIHSEYGMTELLSQAYAQKMNKFQTPGWMKVMIRDINDPMEFVKEGKTGGMNIIDLANIHSCSFIETKDLGCVNSDGTFEVLGRFDNSDIRGCNLMII